jgi:hypothetical protein
VSRRRAAALAALLLAAPAWAGDGGKRAPAPRARAAADRAGLQRPLGAAEVDWQAGLVIARAGAAADLRLPGPENARPAAERQASKRAAEILRAALAALPLGGGRTPAADAVTAAVARAKPSSVEYQSNGGVLLALAVPFAELGAVAGNGKGKGKGKGKGTTARPGASEREVALVAASAPLAAAPTLVVGQREVPTTAARYELGEPPAAALAVKADKDGRLVLRKEADADTLAGARVVVYVKSLVEPGP